MEISHKAGKELRAKIGRIATAFAFAFVICGVATGAAYAADQHGHDNRGGDQHRGNSGHDRGRGGYVAPQTDNYYAPGPNYYTAPEPDYYYAQQPDYYPQQPSQGVNLFFGF
jgi:hypothetical protein